MRLASGKLRGPVVLRLGSDQYPGRCGHVSDDAGNDFLWNTRCVLSIINEKPFFIYLTTVNASGIP